MTKILFVCHGNICRSPAAEIVFRALTDKAGLSDEYSAASAATTSEEIGNPVYPPMRRVLEERGYDCSGKTAVRVRKSDYDKYDLIIGMDEENSWDLRRVFHGDPNGKLHNFSEYIGLPDQEIPDPWYTRDFSGCLSVIEECCEALFEELSGVVFLDFSLCGDISSLFEEMRHKMDWEDWYGENLDALHDIMTGLPHKGSRFVITMPYDDAPSEVRLYASKIAGIINGKAEEAAE